MYVTRTRFEKISENNRRRQWLLSFNIILVQYITHSAAVAIKQHETRTISFARSAMTSRTSLGAKTTRRNHQTALNTCFIVFPTNISNELIVRLFWSIPPSHLSDAPGIERLSPVHTYTHVVCVCVKIYNCTLGMRTYHSRIRLRVCLCGYSLVNRAHVVKFFGRYVFVHCTPSKHCRRRDHESALGCALILHTEPILCHHHKICNELLNKLNSHQRTLRVHIM